MSHDVGDLLLQTVPFARTLGITFTSTGDGRATCVLPDREDLHNHVGGPHAGAMFTLAESASGAAMLSLLGDQLSRAVPLVAASTVRYRKLAKGDVTAEARLQATREDVLARLDAGERAEFGVEVDLRNAGGDTVAALTVTWAFVPNRT